MSLGLTVRPVGQVTRERIDLYGDGQNVAVTTKLAGTVSHRVSHRTHRLHKYFIC